MSQGGARNSVGESADLSGVLNRFLNLIPDARQITISSAAGAELLSASRIQAATPEDSHTISSLAPCFSSSYEQSSRLGLGGSKYAVTWAANSIILQTKVESLIVSILLDENANLGVAEEHFEELKTLLLPFCEFESS